MVVLAATETAKATFLRYPTESVRLSHCPRPLLIRQFLMQGGPQLKIRSRRDFGEIDPENLS
jgi:hypothetical protein